VRVVHGPRRRNDKQLFAPVGRWIARSGEAWSWNLAARRPRPAWPGHPARCLLLFAVVDPIDQAGVVRLG